MNPFFQIEIPKRSNCCSLRNERLLPGMDYYSLLTENGNQQIVRQDFCVSCWQELIKQQNLTNSQGYWKSKIEQKKALPASRSEKVLILLKNLLINAHQHEAEIFILAIFLSHAKRLALRKEFEREGAKWGLYEILQQDEFITIKILPFSQIETGPIQQVLAEKLTLLS